MIKIKNIALFDSSQEEARDFIRGLEKQTGEKWEAIVCKSNNGRKGCANIIRYIKYFIFPLLIFLKRRHYKVIIGWQEFYGLLYAFYCTVFHVKKMNTLIIKNFIYKPKKGVTGKLYYRFMKYIVKSKYVDIFICASKTMVNYCCEVFEEPKNRFVFIPFGVNDFSMTIDSSNPPTEDYILSLGRSNRDWDFLINSFSEIKTKLVIICDELHRDKLPDNIIILNNVWGRETYKYIYNCKCMIIPIADGRIASGDTVLLYAMSFSKPIIITKPSCLADDYVTDGYNGIVIEKKPEELKKAIDILLHDNSMFIQLANNARKHYEDNHSLYSYGMKVGKLLC